MHPKLIPFTLVLLLLMLLSCNDNPISGSGNDITLISRGLNTSAISSLREGNKYLFAAAGKDGLYRIMKSDITTGNWEYLGFSTSDLGTRGVVDVAVFGDNDEIICAGIGNDDSTHPGLMRSTDGGRSWLRSDSNLIGGAVGWPFLQYVHSADYFAVSPLYPERVFTVNGHNSAVYWSQDAGAHWDRTDNPGVGHDGFMGMVEVEPTRPERIWAAGRGWGDMVPFLQRSTQSGIDWRFVEVSPLYYQHNGIRGMDFDDSGTVYLSFRNEVAYSTNDGLSWQELLSHDDSVSTFSVFVNPLNQSQIFITGQRLPYVEKNGIMYEFDGADLKKTYYFDKLLIKRIISLRGSDLLLLITNRGIYEMTLRSE